MKYLKKFENNTEDRIIPYNYAVGDIVISLYDHKSITDEYLLKKGDKYKVLKIERYFEDKYLGTPYMRVSVENIITGKKTVAWTSDNFTSEVSYVSKKYNL